MAIRLDGVSLRCLREERGLDLDVFAKLMNVHRRTIERWETGDSVLALPRVIEIKKTLDKKKRPDQPEVPLEKLGTTVPKIPRKRRLTTSAPATTPAPKQIRAATVKRLQSGERDWSEWAHHRQFMSELERLALVEKETSPPPDVWSDGAYPVLTANALWNIHSARGLHEMSAFSVTGYLAKQRRMNKHEQAVLRCSDAFGSRFLILKEIDDQEQPLALTVYATNAEYTRYLQMFMRRTIRLLVRVLIVVEDPEHGGALAVSDHAGGGKRIACPPEFKGFFLFDEEKTTQWALVVERTSEPVLREPGGGVRRTSTRTARHRR